MPYSVGVANTAATPERLKYIAINRDQLQWAVLDVEELIPENHPARIIWEVTGRLELQGFEREGKSREGEAGRPCWSARALVSVWVYGYSLGVASARALARMMSYEPGLRWLAANQEINYHTLADFRVGHQAALPELFAQLLALLETAGVVDLKTLLQDGTKVRAVAGSGSLHRRATLEKRLWEARRVVRKLDQQASAEEALDQRRSAAQRRAAQEAVARAEAALQKLQQLEAATAPSKQAALRVSDSEPEARKMKHPDGGWAPSYNVQVTTEAQSRMIVAIGVTSECNDTQQLLPALEKVKENSGTLPERVIADNGYATRTNVEGTAEQQVELIAPWKPDSSREAGACARNGMAAEFAPSQFGVQRGGQKLICPAGKTLVVIQEKVHHGVRKQVFEARARDCRRCRWQEPCCGSGAGPRRIERVVESRAMKQYLARMKRRGVRELYRQRSEIAEFPNLWAKGVKQWRRFHVRGLVKAGMETIWVALAYNLAQWMRLGNVLAVGT